MNKTAKGRAYQMATHGCGVDDIEAAIGGKKHKKRVLRKEVRTIVWNAAAIADAGHRQRMRERLQYEYITASALSARSEHAGKRAGHSRAV